ncbi:MAG: hypothetical protein R3250_03145, partial [Melioribacteraceae bacterium]|nr:hypothetical protein [Melioribacteraceae bacterium]
GSNKDEYFEIVRNADASVTVNMYDALDKQKGENLYYSRKILKDETSDIRIYGLDGRDIFNISGNCDESITVRIIGGTGKDSINDVSISNAKTLVYDKGKRTSVNMSKNTDHIKPYNKNLYKYNRTAFKYDTYFPLPYLSYNKDDGLIVNAGISFTLHNFETEDYSAKHKIQISVSTKESYGIEYWGRFRHLYEGWDLILSGHYDEPLPYTYFYGFGNETKKDDKKYDQNYYRTRYSSRGLTLGIARDFWKRSSFQIDIKYENNEHQEESGLTIFSDNSVIGSQKVNLIEGSTILNLDFRNHTDLPTSGTRIYAEYFNGFVTNLNYKNYGKLLILGEAFISFPSILPLTLGIRGGGGKSFGKIPFYEQFTLGQNNYLKGYTNNRFTGKSIAFIQTGLRLNLFGFNGTLVPMKVGLLGYFNSGRVFQPGESSKKWHNGFGGGLFVIPLREEYTFYTTVSFSEEESFLFEIGLGTAL